MLSIPLGCTVANDAPRWYVVDGKGGGPVFLDEDKFFRAGIGKHEHLRFWDPVKERVCRAEFDCVHRPRPHSPPPNASYLEDAMSELSSVAMMSIV
ncbi:hypothetical protein C8A05DRAFT_29961 [Staphylotrichum tortipilum]|uniref:Uncharacterized protein n=1 Tax=Staphylotrichum tortipilum TaxID=2831512 RepID=A0AAN6MS91_9PEZI|nr:hypothetical protein C8A05DRAFT_29961 [Staphylotrichum longicolle]